MPFTRLTLWGAFASLRSESQGKGHSKTKADVCSPGLLDRWLAWMTLAAVVGAAGCASVAPGSSAEQKQRVVAERAQARWELLLKGDVASAYQFLSAGSKAATPVDVYKTKVKPGMWRQVKVGKVDCEAELCKVVMMVTYDVKQMKGIETPVDETWIIENGSAWYVYR
jgi:hypothetical protein